MKLLRVQIDIMASSYQCNHVCNVITLIWVLFNV